MRKKRTKSTTKSVARSVPPQPVATGPRLLVTVKPKTRNQNNYVKSIDVNTLTISTGPAGTGKTLLASYIACKKLLNGEVKKLILTRPMVQTGKNTVGFLPGNLEEKIAEYLIPLYDYLCYFIGESNVKELVEKKIINFCCLEMLRGRTFDESFIILDEAQNANLDQLLLLTTRVGNGSTLVINGDLKQSDINTSGLYNFIDRIDGVDSVNICEFDKDDILRSKFVKDVLERFE